MWTGHWTPPPHRTRQRTAMTAPALPTTFRRRSLRQSFSDLSVRTKVIGFMLFAGLLTAENAIEPMLRLTGVRDRLLTDGDVDAAAAGISLASWLIFWSNIAAVVFVVFI